MLGTFLPYRNVLQDQYLKVMAEFCRGVLDRSAVANVHPRMVHLSMGDSGPMSPGQLQEFASLVRTYVGKGLQVVVRWAPEFNLPEITWGGNPRQFIANWVMVAVAVGDSAAMFWFPDVTNEALSPTTYDNYSRSPMASPEVVGFLRPVRGGEEAFRGGRDGRLLEDATEKGRELEVKRTWWNQLFSRATTARFLFFKGVLWFNSHKREDKQDTDMRIFNEHDVTTSPVLVRFESDVSLSRGSLIAFADPATAGLSLFVLRRLPLRYHQAIVMQTDFSISPSFLERKTVAMPGYSAAVVVHSTAKTS